MCAGLILAAVASLLPLLLAAPPASAQEAPPPPPPSEPAGESRTLRVVTKELVPFVIPGDSGFSGFSIDLMDALAERLGVEYELEEVATVEEQLAAVAEGAADLAIAGISITEEREEVVDFSHPMYDSGLQILVRSGDRSTLRQVVSVFFSAPVLTLVGGLLLLMILMAHFIWLVERRRKSDFPRPYVKGVGEGVWWSAVTMTTVGYGDRTPRTPVGRGLAIVWMFLALILVANFTASVTSALTVEGLQGAINGPQDLPGKTVATLGGTSSAEYLRGRSVDLVEAGTMEEAYESLVDGDVDAVVFDSPVLLYFASNVAGDEVRVTGPVFQPQDYGIALPPGSPDREAVNTALLSLIEDGTYGELEDRWFGTSG